MSFAELEKALRSRFGSEHHREIYKMELENRKRRPHESLSDLMQDARRLVVLRYGNDQGPMWESVAIKSFLGALDDPHLALEIRKQRPATLNAAYGYYRTTPSERVDGDRGKRRDQARSARVDEEQNRQENNWQRDMLKTQKSTMAEMQQLIKHMQRQWNEQRELFEMALRALRVYERQVPHESSAGVHHRKHQSTLTVWDGNLKEDQTSIEHPGDAVTGAMRWVILFVTALSLTHESWDHLAAILVQPVRRRAEGQATRTKLCSAVVSPLSALLIYQCTSVSMATGVCWTQGVRF